MSFKSSLKFDSPIFSQSKRRAAGGRAVRKSAREFVKDVRDKMENSPHTGKIITVTRGGNFRIRHQQSRRGQRPAPLTRKLKNSVKDRRVSETESIVDVEAEHAEYQVKLGRVIVSAKDEAEAQRNLDKNVAVEIGKLL